MPNMTVDINGTSYPAVNYFNEPYFLYPISALYVIIIIISTIGCSLVILTICRCQSLRNSTTNFFILSLAVSDLITATAAMTLDLDLLLHNNKWQYSALVCEIWATIYLSTVPISILTLLAVGLDRYKTLSDPMSRFREYQFMTRKRAAIVIIVIWIYCIVFASIPFMGWKHHPVSVREGECLFNITYIYSATSSLMNFILPLIITTFLYGKIYLIARRHGSENFSQSICYMHKLPNTTEQKAFMNNLKAVRTVSAIVCGFLICWMPFTILSITMCFCRECVENIPEKLYASLLLLGYSNCALNPFLYSFKNKKFRKCCKLMLRSLLPKHRPAVSRPTAFELQAVLRKHRCSDVLFERTHSLKLTSLCRFHSVPNVLHLPMEKNLAVNC
ncbi:octopamine receptor-like [Exaiptasia diaphana]|uniref:G-protein coupled receptors family 1 profile domain-containing protein n=1 Tax=Exaiptasia diaphana TaxID=2652724 RepID=A0A913XM98_EXADI|nr:octopamine receptor-like [Exaiptasia diaphana]XP_020906366.1 octopamine receptor-like [Exaiptasia diaphana]XP_020906367.1 octopamine receptor-like [Exaiptasia diaphana]